MRYLALTLFMSLMALPLAAQQMADVPAVYANIRIERGQYYYIAADGERHPLNTNSETLNVAMFRNITSTGDGLKFDFTTDNMDEQLNGTLYYGFTNPDAQYQQPVFFKKPVPIVNGIARVRIGEVLTGKYDMVGWQTSGIGELGYRVVNAQNEMLYDGKVTFGYDTLEQFFYLPNGIVEGPFLAQVAHDSVVIRYETLKPSRDAILARVASDTTLVIKSQDAKATRLHELPLTGLSASTDHLYEIHIANPLNPDEPRRQHQRTYRFRTAPKPNARTAFKFGFCSDSRAGQGGGERNLFGTNAYIMKRNAALAVAEGCAFVQFTGDMISGYQSMVGHQELQYANWKRAIEPFCHGMPFIVGMGNHEALVNEAHNFGHPDHVSVDKWPFATHSAEAVFAQQFCNPSNGPSSEDGSALDPNPKTVDFPTYQENCFYYTYGNVAVIVLNSDYLYAPTLGDNPRSNGNLHGYLMDEQMEWLSWSLLQFEMDDEIDHVIVTQHTPAFPNGGHSKDDMWYAGDNSHRPVIGGQPADKGIIERRDEYLDMLVNKSSKVRAILSGDEHNYSRTRISDAMPRYPEGYNKPKVKLSRDIWQLTNGAAGAPYYAQEVLPWSDEVAIFSTQNCLLIFEVDGKDITVRAKNPDTLEDIEAFELVLD